MRIVVDLPAPFGPRKPSTSPRSTEKETPSTACLVPKIFVRLSTLIILSAVRVSVSGHKEMDGGQKVNHAFFAYRQLAGKMFKKFMTAGAGVGREPEIAGELGLPLMLVWAN